MRIMSSRKRRAESRPSVTPKPCAPAKPAAAKELFLSRVAMKFNQTKSDLAIQLVGLSLECNTFVNKCAIKMLSSNMFLIHVYSFWNRSLAF